MEKVRMEPRAVLNNVLHVMRYRAEEKGLKLYTKVGPTVPVAVLGDPKSWRDYFKVNTDHKVIGIQYIVTTFFFFILGGLMAPEAIRQSPARPAAD